MGDAWRQGRRDLVERGELRFADVAGSSWPRRNARRKRATAARSGDAASGVRLGRAVVEPIGEKYEITNRRVRMSFDDETQVVAWRILAQQISRSFLAPLIGDQ